MDTGFKILITFKSKANMKTFGYVSVINRILSATKLSGGNIFQSIQSARLIFSSKTNRVSFGSRSWLLPVLSVQFSDNHIHLARHFSLNGKRLKECLSAADLKKAMDQLTEQFTEARELIEDARESLDTVYFSEDMSEAQEAVISTLDQYHKLLDQLSDDQRQNVLRTIGLRMEELKAQEQALKDALHDSH